jgi:hypothetical protein
MVPALLGGCAWLALAPALQRSLGAPAGEPLPAPRNLPTSVRFVAIGDYGTTLAGSFAVADLVHALAPAFIVTLGDNNYPNGAAGTIDANIGQHYHDYIHPYAGSFGPGAPVRRFYPSLGNHDWIATGALPYLAYFELPHNERYYSFRRGPVELFALDSDPHEPDGIEADSVQAAWLETRLAASDAPFRVVYMHHAPYCSSASHGSHGVLQWPFREWGASLVLTGHDHLYERLSVSGFPYVVNGVGGNVRYDFGAPIGGSQLRFAEADGATLVTGDAGGLRVAFVGTGEVVLDDFFLPPGGVDPGVSVLVAEGASWRYLDTGVDPGPGWTASGFDDSAWAIGDAELGYGDGDEQTTVGYGPNPGAKYITTWFRHAFAVAAPADFGELQLRLLRDDGARVFLNGVEVARDNLPAGAITAATLASSPVSAEDESTFFPAVFAPAALVAGTNVLAVEVHQSGAASTDLSFDLELVGLGAGATLLAPGADWRYLDTGVDPGAGWDEPAFDDSAWSLAPAPLGYGEPDLATTVSFGSDPANKHRTTWFRAAFTVPSAAAVAWLECRLRRDDGAILYLNGSEAARFDLPRAGVAASTLAPHDVAGEAEGIFERTSLDPRLLLDGLNTIAVEVHQASPGSDDLAFDLALVAH